MMVVIKTYNTRVEAEVDKGFLETQGIKANIIADDEGGMAPYPLQPSSSGVKLFVQKKDLNKARVLLKK